MTWLLLACWGNPKTDTADTGPDSAPPVDTATSDTDSGQPPDSGDSADTADSGGDSGDSGGEPVEGPDIDVQPASLDLGSVVIGDAASATLELHNLGTEDLLLSEVSLLDGDVFELGSVDTLTVVPGEHATLEVSFEPSAPGLATDTIVVSSTDPDEPTVEVALSGLGLGGELSLSPTEHDFGGPYIGCTETVDVQIDNTGTDVATVSSVSFSTASTELVVDLREADNGPLPWSLAVGASALVSVSYAPVDEYADLGYLTVDSGSGGELATLAGQGVLYGTNVDVHEQVGAGTSFALSSIPVAATVEVFIDGVMASGWSYDAKANAVVFKKAPAHGATVEISYALPGPC
ncbi:MAG: choice-of-anchor D domain-containing protein [Proteobacteria bacterium]|nr:choice-of-anchor D domain-containing protein [Pseudomonadota bacterium]